MDIPEGYKQTEVGVIPDDWSVKFLGEILKVRHGRDQKEVQSKYGEFPILGSGGIMGYANSYLYNLESVLIGRKGTIDKPQYMDTPFWTVDTLFYTEIEKHISPKYVYYEFNLIDWYSYNEASGVPSLNAKTIQKIQIPLPPTKAEQEKIATALSDADALITSLEKLIDKKRKIKQGAMQELLTGRKRLPGFEKEKGYKETEVGVIPKDWVVKTLSKISSFDNGTAHEQFIDDQGYYIVVNSKFISTESKVRKYSNKNLCPLYKGSIAIVMSDIPNGKALAKCFFVEKNERYTLNQRIGCISANEDIDNKFLFYKLNRNKYFLSFDSGAGQTNLRKIEIQRCPVIIPKEIGEQTAIATILNNMNTEIEVLEKKLGKYKKIKQGMMQNLLTGRIRLV